jgi:predicted deacylase
VSRFVDEDFNRLWSKDILSSERQSSELTRARALRSVVAEADYLLDIHSMLGPSPALMLSGLAEKGRSLARAVGRPIHIVADGGHKAGPRMRDFGDFGKAKHPRTALLVECGQHWKTESVNCAVDTMLDFLSALKVIDPEIAAERRQESPPGSQRMIEVTHAVTVETDNFRFERDFTGLEVIGEADTVIAVDDERPIATPYDNCVLVMPSRNALKGQTAVRLGKLLD